MSVFSGVNFSSSNADIEIGEVSLKDAKMKTGV